MSEIYLSNINTPQIEREALIEKLDDIFQNEQLIMSVYSWADQYYPIKSIKHFIANSPTYKVEGCNLIVWFNPNEKCLSFKNTLNGRVFHVRMANKKYLEDFPFIYEGKPKNPETYIIPIKFK